jgi:hypothetical protein
LTAEPDTVGSCPAGTGATLGHGLLIAAAGIVLGRQTLAV